MKKIISVILSVCMLMSLTAIFTSAADPSRVATVKAALESGYGIWDLENEQIIVHIADDTTWANVGRKTFIGFCVSSMSNNKQGTGIIRNPYRNATLESDAAGDNVYAQYGGIIVNGSMDSTEKTFAFKVNPQNLSDIVSGANTDAGYSFPQLIKDYGGIYAVRLDATDANGSYIGYCFPVYDEAPDGLRFTSAEMGSDGKIVLRFNSEVDNQWDGNNANAGLNGTIYDGVARTTDLVIVDNTTDWNIQSVGGTQAIWGQSWIEGCWNGAQGFYTMTVNYQGILGCNSYADVCALVDKGGALEGCVVAYRIEETITAAAGNASAVAGDGYINSIYCYGTFGDINYCLKANKTPVTGQLDAAYVAMYDPNPIEWVETETEAVETPLEAQIVDVTTDSTGLYVSFSEPVATPPADACLALVAYGWPAGEYLRYTRRVELTNPTVVDGTDNTVWKFPCSSEVKSWFLSGDISAEGHYGTTLPHPVDGNDGARWFVMLFGDVKSADGTKTLAVDTTKTVYDSSVSANARCGYVLFSGTEAESGTYAERRVGINTIKVSSVSDLNTVGATLYIVDGETDYVYLSFTEPVTLGADFHLSECFMHRWNGADPSYVIWYRDTISDVVEQVDTAGCVYRVTQSAWRDAHTAYMIFDPTSTGYNATRSVKTKIVITGTVTTKDNGEQITYYDADDTGDNWGCRFHNDTSGANYSDGLDITWNVKKISDVSLIPGMDTDVCTAVITYTDSTKGDGTIDKLYINSVAGDDGTYGILFAEDTYATDALMRLPSDGGNPLFSKICEHRTAILQTAAYGSAEITPYNTIKGATADDSLIAICWTNMPAYTTFAARVYKVLSNGDVVYGSITTITLTDGASYAPLA